MNIFYYIILILIVIFFIIINIKNIIIEKFICINPKLINNNGTCEHNFFIGNNSNSEQALKICNNNDNCNGYSNIKYNLNNNIGYINFKCLDNWDGKIIYDNDKLIYNKLINNVKNKDNIEFSDLKTYKCNKTCPPGKGIKDDSLTCFDCPDKQYNTGDSYQCKDIAECPTKYNLINYDKKTGNIICKINSRPGYYYDVNSKSEKKCHKGTYTDSYGNSKCINVSEGHYVDEIGQTTQKPYSITRCGPGKKLTPGTKTKDGICNDCPTGTFSKGGENNCTDYKTTCEYGQKLVGGSKSEDKKCENCPDGYYSDGKNCTKVRPGYKRKKDKSGEEPCIPGTYSTGGTNDCMGWSSSICSGGQKLSGGSNTEDRICVECPDGYYSKGIFTTCRIVDPGYKRAPGKSTQRPCSAGSYSTGGTNDCTPCPDKTYSSSSGSTTCTDWTSTTCPSGQKLVGGSNIEDKICVSCSPGEFSPGNTSTKCTEVQSGYQIKEDKSGQEICPKGTFSKGGENICTDCPNGQYSLTDGSSNCTDWTATTCPSGQKLVGGSNIEDKICVSCSPGEFSPGNTSTKCTEVQSGYQIKEDKSGQEICPKGTFSKGGKNICTSCPDGQYSSNAGSSKCTPVSPGYKRKQDKTGQLPCPDGKYSGGSTNDCKVCGCPNNQYTPNCGGDKKGTCIKCPACGNGRYRSGCSGTNSGTCTLCSTCPGYKYRPNCGGTNPGSCVPCPSCPYGYVRSNCSFNNPGTCQKIPQKCTIM